MTQAKNSYIMARIIIRLLSAEHNDNILIECLQ